MQPYTNIFELTHEVWFEYILPFFSSNQLLPIRLVNRHFSELIFTFIIQFKTKFKIRVGFPNIKLKKIVQFFLIRLKQLNTIVYEDYDNLVDYCLTDQGITQLHPLQHIEILNLENLRTYSGSFIQDWIDLASPLLHSLQKLFLNGVNEENLSLFGHFTSLKELSIKPLSYENMMDSLDGSVLIKLPSSMVKLTLGYFMEMCHLKDIAQQCPNIRSLTIGLPLEILENIGDEFCIFKSLETLKILSHTHHEENNEYTAPILSSLKNIQSLTNLQLTGPMYNDSTYSRFNMANLKQISFLNNLKTLHLTIPCMLFTGDSAFYEHIYEEIVKNVCKLYSLTDLSLILNEYEETLEMDSYFLDHIPRLANLKKLKLESSYVNPFITPLLKHFYVPSLIDLEVIAEQTLNIEEILNPVQYFPDLVNIYFECSIESHGFWSRMFNQIDLSKIRSLQYESLELNDLELISQMRNLENLVLSINFVGSFKHVTLPKRLKTFKMMNCRHLTGIEECFFQNFIENCPLLKSLEFETCTQLQDQFIKNIYGLIINGVDLEKILFTECPSLTSELIHSFQYLTTCNLVMFKNCRGIHYSKEISHILRKHEFIQIFGGTNELEYDMDMDIEKYTIRDLNSETSLDEFGEIVQHLVNSKQYYRSFLTIHANLFVNEGPLKSLFLNADSDTKWFYYFSMLRTSTSLPFEFSYEEIVKEIIDLLSIDSSLSSTITEERRKSFVELLVENNECVSTCLDLVVPFLIKTREYNTACNLIIAFELFETGDVNALKEVMTVDDCFRAEYLHDLLTLNDEFTEKLVRLSPFFQNCTSFIEELASKSIIIERCDPETLEITERVPHTFENAFLTELIINFDNEEVTSEIFEAFGYRWSLKICRSEWVQIYLQLVSPIHNSRDLSQYEFLTGNDGDSVEISFMVLNFDNNPHSYLSGHVILDQASLYCYRSIRSRFIQPFSDNRYKFLVGLKMVNRCEQIPCVFMSPKYSIHKISFSVPLDLDGYLYNNLNLYSDPIHAFGIKWTVKFEKELTTGIFGLYLMLASFDLFNKKEAFQSCRVFFYFANKNLHPDSTTQTLRKTFSDMSSVVGTEITNNTDLFKPTEERIDGEIFERYDINLILEVKEIK